MGFLKRLVGDEQKASKSDFVDLGDYNVSAAKDEPVTAYIKVAEVARAEEVADLAEEVYGGHILILDIKNAAKDEFQLRKITAELKKVAADVGGDVAGIGDGLICITPRGIKVDRQKLRVTA